MAKKLIGNQSRIDMNKNGRIDAEDFKILRSTMNGAYRNEKKHVNHNEDYEIRYAKTRPARKGYKGKRNFDDGGTIDAFTIRVVKGVSGKPNEVISDPREVKFAGGGEFMTDPTFGNFQNNVYAGGGAVKNERKHVNHSEDYEIRYAKPRPSRKGYRATRKFDDGGGVEGKDTWQNIFEEYGFKKGRSKYGLDMYYKRGYIGSIDKNLRNVDLMFEDDVIYKGYSIQGLLDVMENQFGKRKFNDGGKVTSFTNKDGIRVRSKVEPKEKMSEKEWMAKHNSSKEARSYMAGGKTETPTKKGKGNHKMKAVTDYAKKIRKDGEKWTDALRRAYQEMK